MYNRLHQGLFSALPRFWTSWRSRFLKFAPLAGSISLLTLTSPKHAGPVETKKKKGKKNPSIFLQRALLWKAVQGSWWGTVSQEWYTSHGRLSLSSPHALSPTWNLQLAAHSRVTAVRHDSAAKLLFITVLITCCRSFCWEKRRGRGSEGVFVVRGLRKRIKFP